MTITEQTLSTTGTLYVDGRNYDASTDTWGPWHITDAVDGDHPSAPFIDLAVEYGYTDQQFRARLVDEDGREVWVSEIVYGQVTEDEPELVERVGEDW